MLALVADVERLVRIRARVRARVRAKVRVRVRARARVRADVGRREVVAQAVEGVIDLAPRRLAVHLRGRDRVGIGVGIG